MARHGTTSSEVQILGTMTNPEGKQFSSAITLVSTLDRWASRARCLDDRSTSIKHHQTIKAGLSQADVYSHSPRISMKFSIIAAHLNGESFNAFHTFHTSYYYYYLGGWFSHRKSAGILAEVDLAGSERLAKSGVSGDRQKEAAASGQRPYAGATGATKGEATPDSAQTWPKSFSDVASYEGKIICWNMANLRDGTGSVFSFGICRRSRSINPWAHSAMSLLQGLGNQAPEAPGGSAPIQLVSSWPSWIPRILGSQKRPWPVWADAQRPQRPQILVVDRLSAAWSQGAEECAHTIQELSADSLPAGAAVGWCVKADIPTWKASESLYIYNIII